MHHLLKACAAAVLLLWSCNITADNRNGRWEVVTNSDHTVTLLCNGDTRRGCLRGAQCNLDFFGT